MTGDQVPSTARGSRRRVIAGVVVIGLVAAVAWGAWTWRSPRVFVEYGGYGYGFDDPGDGDVHYVGMSDPAAGVEGEVTIRSAEARVVERSPDAEVDLYVCTIDESAGVGAIGSVGEADIRRSCSSLVPADGATLQVDPREAPRQQLVLAFALPQPGVVRIRGVDLDYSYGWRRGSQQIGGDLDAVRSR